MKHKRLFKRFFHSIFTKLLFILFATGLLINISVMIFFRFGFSDTYKKPFRNNFIEHIYYLVEDIGTPVDKGRAEYVALKSGFDIYYKNQHDSWSTSATHLSFDTIKKAMNHGCSRRGHLHKHFTNQIDEKDKKSVENNQQREKALEKMIRSRLSATTNVNEIKQLENRLKLINEKPIIMAGFVNRRLAALYETKDESIIFYRSVNLSHKHGIAVLVLLIVLTLIIFGAYFFVKKTLEPVKTLEKGVATVAGGDLSYQIKTNRKDELGKLSQAFNEMTQQIKKMLHAKEELLIDISHELRSPITRAKVALEFLQESDTKQSISDDIRELETMISEILDGARLSTNHVKPVKKETLLSDFLKGIVTKNAEYKALVKVETIPETVSLSFDPDLIKTVIRNLLDNAIKYSDKDKGRIAIRHWQSETHHVIEVKDNGIGIPENELPFIFEPFYRVDKSRSKKTGGYGLGLSLCKSIMKAHGGSIEARSSDAEGTTILLYFT